MKRVQRVLEDRIRRADWFPKAYNRDFNQGFFLESIDRLYLIHFFCVQEVSHMCELLNHGEIAETLYMTFTGFRYIYEALADCYVRTYEELAEIKKSSNFRYVHSEDPVNGKNMTLKELDDARNKRAAELEEEAKQRESNRIAQQQREDQFFKRGNGVFGFEMDFADKDEAAERELKEKIYIQSAVDLLRKDMDDKKKINFDSIKDPRIIIEFNNQLYDNMISDSKQHQSYLRKTILEYQGQQEINLQSPGELQRLVYINTRLLQTFDLKNLVTPSGVDDQQLMKHFSDSENSLFKAFNQKQRSLVVKVSQIIKQSMTKVKADMGISTYLSNKDIDKLYATVSIVDLAPNQEMKRELAKAKQEVGRANASQKYFRDKIEELSGVIQEKEFLIKGLSEGINSLKRATGNRSDNLTLNIDLSKPKPGENPSKDIVSDLQTELKRKDNTYSAKELECESLKKRNESMWNALDYARKVASKNGVIRTDSMADIQVIIKLEAIITTAQSRITKLEEELDINQIDEHVLDIGNGRTVKTKVSMKHAGTDTRHLGSKQASKEKASNREGGVSRDSIKAEIQSEESLPPILTLSVINIAKFLPKLTHSTLKTSPSPQPGHATATAVKVIDRQASKSTANHKYSVSNAPSKTSAIGKALVSIVSPKADKEAISKNRPARDDSRRNKVAAKTDRSNVIYDGAVKSSDSRGGKMADADVLSGDTNNQKLHNVSEYQEKNISKVELDEAITPKVNEILNPLNSGFSNSKVKLEDTMNDKASENTNQILTASDSQIKSKHPENKTIINNPTNNESIISTNDDKPKLNQESLPSPSPTATHIHTHSYTPDITSLLDHIAAMPADVDAVHVRCLLTRSRVVVVDGLPDADIIEMCGGDPRSSGVISRPVNYFSISTATLPTIRESVNMGQDDKSMHNEVDGLTDRNTVNVDQRVNIGNKWQPSAFSSRRNSGAGIVSHVGYRENSTVALNGGLPELSNSKTGNQAQRSEISTLRTKNHQSTYSVHRRELEAASQTKSQIKSHRRNMSTNLPEGSGDNATSLIKSRSQVGIDLLQGEDEPGLGNSVSQRHEATDKYQSMVMLDDSTRSLFKHKRNRSVKNIDNLGFEEIPELKVNQELSAHHGESVISQSQIGNVPTEYQVFVPQKHNFALSDQLNILVDNNHDNDELLEKLYVESAHCSIPALRNDLNLAAVGTQMVVRSFNDFKAKVKIFVKQHSTCGPKCSHLQRFYERCGLPNIHLKSIGNRQPYIFPLVDMNKRVPKAQLAKEVTLQVENFKRKEEKARNLAQHRVFI